jgi:hypothetical protein
MTVFPLFLKKFFAFAPIIHPGEEKSHPAGENPLTHGKARRELGE